jgi:uncharacterized membrane protein
MTAMLLLHILAGGLGLASGFVALYAAKGAALHRRSGMLFVFAMLAMCVGGLAITAVRGVAAAVNFPAGLLTAYLVVTSLTTLRPSRARWLDVGAMLVALALGVACLLFGLEAVASGGARKGIPAFPFLLFAAVGLLAGISDIRILRSGRLRGPSRLARHLWRMCFALLIASLSFFLGQAKVIPEPIRIEPLLWLPIAAVLVTMLYWLWRVRIRRTFRGSRPAPRGVAQGGACGRALSHGSRFSSSSSPGSS